MRAWKSAICPETPISLTCVRPRNSLRWREKCAAHREENLRSVLTLPSRPIDSEKGLIRFQQAIFARRGDLTSILRICGLSGTHGFRRSQDFELRLRI